MNTAVKMFKCFVFVTVLIGSCLSSTEDFTQLKSALPSPVTYYKLPDLNPSIESNEKNENSKGVHEPRFGLHVGYGNDLQGYSGGNIMGNYTPLKIDLGGVVLGTVIGLGAVLLAPKLLTLFSTHHSSGSYARSEGDNMFGNIGNVIERIDETLQEHKIDSMACLQKAACSLVGYATSSPSKDILHNTSNPILNFLIDGSKLKSAMERGLKGDNCATAYPHCSLSSSSLLKENRI